ncbi:hypothetical protein HY480_00065 [Candidatus Uhrbacteria bacterium]|nr:hypothetical protein [Candidatus Uhrbacteria bacterium]
MPVHARLLALVAVFALANVGVATYIAAAPQQPAARVTIAAASDDMIPAQQPAQSPSETGEQAPAAPTPSAPPPGEPAQAPAQAVAPACGQGLTLVALPAQGGTITPDANVHLAQFRVEYPTTGRCVPPEPAKVRSLTLGFKWSNSDPQFLRRAVLRNIRILNARGAVLGTLGLWSSTSRDAIITLRTPLAVSYGGIEVLNLTADLRGVPLVQNATPVGLATRVIRMNADLAYGFSLGTVRVGRIPTAQLAVELDANSPSGTQTAGTGKELARYRILLQGTEPITITRYYVQFEDAEGISSFTPADIRYILERTTGASVNTLAPRQWYQLRITGDTTGMPIGGTLRLILENITARGVTTGTNFDHGVMSGPVPANALTY